MVCSPGKRYQNGKCITFLSTSTNISYIFSQKLRFKRDISSTAKVFSIIQDIHKVIVDIIDKKMTIIHEYFVANDTCSATLGSTEGGYLEILLNFLFLTTGKLSRTALEHSIITNFLKPIRIGNIEGEVLDNKSYKAFHLPSLINSMSQYHCKFFKTNGPFIVQYNFHIDKFLNCPQVSLAKSEYTLSHHGTSLEVHALNKVYTFSDFTFGPNSDPRVCVEDFHPSAAQQNWTTLFIKVLMYVCYALSSLCLISTTAVYCAIDSLRTRTPMSSFILCIVILIRQVSILIGSQGPQQDCSIIGSFIHYFLFAVFCSMFNCSYQHYVIVKDSNQSSNYIRRGLIGVFVVPLFVVGIYIIYCIIVAHKKPYSGTNCFIDDVMFYIYFVMIPAVAVCLSNLTILYLTLRHNPKTERNVEVSRQTIVYFKLLIMAFTASILLLIDKIFPMMLFVILESLVDALQGLYIFVSFICTKYVFNSIKQYLSDKKKMLTSQTRPHTCTIS